MIRSQLESSGIEVRTEVGTNSNSVSLSGWKQYITAFIIILKFIGMAMGAFILDYLGRCRHGSFRI